MPVSPALRVGRARPAVEADHKRPIGTTRLPYLQILGVNRGLRAVAASRICADHTGGRRKQTPGPGQVPGLQCLRRLPLILVAAGVTGVVNLETIAQTNSVRCRDNDLMERSMIIACIVPTNGEVDA